MTANPVDLIGGLATTGNVVKADISSWAKARVAQVLADATEVRNTVLALQLVIFVKALSATYRMDTTDTTTTDDGVSCIISSDGFRFKPISSVPAPTLVSLGGVFASAAVTHQFVTGLDTAGNLLRAQPSASDLSDGLTGTGAVVRATSPALITPALGAATATALAVNGASIPGGAVVSAAGNITSTTGFVGPVLFGGVNTNSSLTVQTTPSASNSGDTLGLYGSTVTIGNQSSAASIINLTGVSGGGITVNIGAVGNGLIGLNVFNGAGSKQTWVSGGGATTITFPAATDTLVGKATADILINKSINASNNTITNLTTAMFAANVVDTDVTLAANSDTRIASQKATKAYVDATAQGLSPKQSVLCATTANITLSGEQTIDGATTSASRALVNHQSTAAQNGIYTTGAGAWVRTLDANAWSELTGAFVFVETGTVNAATGWVCTAAPGGTLGTTAVTFTQFSGAGTYTAGTGLTLTGTSFAIDGTVATLAGAQALTNKTVNGLTLTASSGTLTLNTNTLGLSGSGVVLNLAGTGTTTQTFPTTSATLARTDAGQTFTGIQIFSGQIASNSFVTIGSANAQALLVGASGTNPVFQVDSSTASQVAGLKVTGAVTGGTVAIAVLDSGANASLDIAAKGTGAINIAQNSSGAVNIGNANSTANFGQSGTATVNVGKANSASGVLTLAGSTSGAVTLQSNAVAAGTITIPNGPDTLTANAAPQTLSNKSLTAPVITGAADIQGAVTFSGNITPAQITADQNDYAPTGFSGTSVVRISTDASRNITGLAGGANGRDIYILNVGSFPAVLKDEGAGSTAANRFGFGADLTLASKQGCALLYDSTASRWRQVGGPSASGGGVGTVTSIATGDGLSGGTITTSGTLSADFTTHLGFMSGLTLSTAGSSSTFAVAPGVAVDIAGAGVMKLASGTFTKTTAAWVVGSANGSFDGTGAAPSATAGWYHVFLIKRTDTGVVDVLTSLSATAPTLPSPYTLFRRIGAMKTDGSFHWLLFTQNGNEFLWGVPLADINTTTLSTTAVLFTLSVPTSVKVNALLSGYVSNASVGQTVVSSPDVPDNAPSSGSNFQVPSAGGFGTSSVSIRTNTSQQVRARAGAASTTLALFTFGWVENL